VVIVHQSGHLGVMNSKALEILGINAATRTRPAVSFAAGKGARNLMACSKKTPSSGSCSVS